MSKKTYYYTVSTVFTIVAILHLLRALNGWEAIVTGVVVPIWFSWVAAVLAAYLAIRGYSLVKRR